MSAKVKRRQKRRPVPAPKPASRPYPTMKAWRESHGLNQREAGEWLGVTQTMYSRFERGLKVPHGAQAKHVMTMTGVPLEVLVGVA